MNQARKNTNHPSIFSETQDSWSPFTAAVRLFPEAVGAAHRLCPRVTVRPGQARQISHLPFGNGRVSSLALPPACGSRPRMAGSAAGRGVWGGAESKPRSWGLFVFLNSQQN